MSPNQYRALERLVAADWIGMPLGDTNDDTTLHRATAAAFERRDLARVFTDGNEPPYAKATPAARQLLDRSTP